MNIELVNRNFFEGVLAGIGILPVKKLTRVIESESQIKAKLDMLSNASGPVFYISTSANPAFFNRAIMRDTDSWASHAGMFIPYYWAKDIRRKHPDLLRTRTIRGSLFNYTPAGLLSAVPVNVNGDEILESQIRVEINEPSAVVRDGEYVVFFIREWTQEQADAILYAAYWLYGSPYDIFEIGNWFSNIIPNYRQIRVCSTYMEFVAQGKNPSLDDNDPNNISKGDKEIHSWMLANKIDPNRCSPAHIGKYWFNSNMYYKQIAFNCNLKQAKELI